MRFADIVSATRGTHCRPLDPRLASLCCREGKIVRRRRSLSVGKEAGTTARPRRTHMVPKDTARVNGAGAEFHQVAGRTVMPNRCLGSPAKFPRFRLDGGLLIGVCAQCIPFLNFEFRASLLMTKDSAFLKRQTLFTFRTH